ncbi:MAG: hypothetical protein E7613_02645 [Ruminococcaceae bacterium]|nr:hypothetical protein [Oscillospiraceae bacterium]
MKKLIILIAALLAVSVLLVSCSKEEETGTASPNAPVADKTPESTDPETPAEPEVTDPETPAEPEVTDPEAPVEPEAPAVSGLQATVDAIYEKYPVPFMAGTIPAEMINADSYAYYTGMADDSKVADLLVSESMIGAQAYSLVLVTVKDGEDVNAVADAMINGIDQRKWMCVEADLIKVVTHGNTVMLVMIDSSMEIPVDGFVTAFEEVVGAVEYEAKKA